MTKLELIEALIKKHVKHVRLKNHNVNGFEVFLFVVRKKSNTIIGEVTVRNEAKDEVRVYGKSGKPEILDLFNFTDKRAREVLNRKLSKRINTRRKHES